MNPPVSYFMKEFIVTVQDKQELILTFTPAPNSFAFINGIEIVSMPDKLYIVDKPHPFVDYHTSFYLDNTTSLETLYRLNIGGPSIASVGDTGMFRTWLDDSSYIVGQFTGLVRKWGRGMNVTINYTQDTPAYVAPEILYITQRTTGTSTENNLNNNLTWALSVDTGFNYLVRLHFCEIDEKLAYSNDRVFCIFINNITAEEHADAFQWSGGRGFPVYKDYVIWVPEESHSKQDLWIALHPNLRTKPTYADATLSGLEILKLNKAEGSLTRSNPKIIVVPPDQQHSSLPERAKSVGSSLVAAIVGALTGAVFICILILYLLLRKWKRRAQNSSNLLPFSHTPFSSLQVDLCHRFSIFEIRETTTNFHDQNVIGTGGFGKVYKGYIRNGSIPVAIKRLDSSSNQGTHEFMTEINVLSWLRHVNLVSLIGYCIDEGEMVLVYDYMLNGTLREHLYGSYGNDGLLWKQRLEICIGAARGLHYLHTGLSDTIIHRDVKTTNILLDEKLVAKVSDFGLSKIGLSNNAVSTVVKGTWGYLDPEYATLQQLTEKSDVYSFDVVLFEVLCGRKALNHELQEEQRNLVNWARRCILNETIYHIVDPYLKGKISPECFKKFIETAESCVRNQGVKRPTMHDVIKKLESALELQEAADAEKERMNPGGEYVYPELSYSAPGLQSYPISGEFTMSDISGTRTQFNHWESDLEEEEVAALHKQL